MIYISKEQLEQVEYLISQSMQGNHVLFSSEELHWVFRNRASANLSEPGNAKTMSEEDTYSAEHHIEHLIEQPTLEQKRAYLELLDRETFEKVVRTYFNIVENNLYDQQEVRH